MGRRNNNSGGGGQNRGTSNSQGSGRGGKSQGQGRSGGGGGGQSKGGGDWRDKKRGGGDRGPRKVSTEVYEGVVDHVNARFAFIRSAELEKDVYINSRDLNGAIDGDKVHFRTIGQHRDKISGEVKDIIKRRHDKMVGVLELSDKGYGFLKPDSRKIHQDVFIAARNINDAKDGEKVWVEVIEWSEDYERGPEGKIIEILGEAGTHDVEMHAILYEFDLPLEFPAEVEQEANEIPDTISEAEIKKRRDMRGVTTFTIDPVDAKDFDDALSIQKLDDGYWEIGIHIADVTHYLREGTALEEEAYKRATSVYLVDRVVPMLPERLSNNLCSLVPNEDRLCFGAIFEINDEGQLRKEWYGRTVIHSDRRFAYEDAQERIETGQGDYVEEIQTLNAIAKKFKAKRFAAGAISFESAEIKFKLDEQNRPIEVFPKVRKDAHKLIEEFMLLANRKVAEFCYGWKGRKQDNPMIYRTHEPPDPEKVQSFASFASRFGYQLQTDGKALAASMNKMTEQLAGKPEEGILQSLAIRTMSKAIYSTEARGHYGLAFDHYSHFTSPIRRYPDVMVHRLLQTYLDNQPPKDRAPYQEATEHCSDREKKAADAERASIKYKQVEYMTAHVGEEFDGIISGVAEFGVFVEMNAFGCEGLIRTADLDGDEYIHEPDQYRIIGRFHGQTFTFGDPLRVKVIAAKLDRRSIDLELVSRPD